MKTAISIPDALFRRVDHHAHLLKVSRSEFFARAAARLADDLDDEHLTDAIDAALAQATPDADSEFIAEAARLALGDGRPGR